MSYTFDLGKHRARLRLSLTHRLSEIAGFLRSVHAAVENFTPNSVRDESVPFEVFQAAGQSGQPDPSQLCEVKLHPETSATAARLAVVAIISITEEHLRHAWVPLQVVQECDFTDGKLTCGAWEQKRRQIYDRTKKMPFGDLIRCIAKDIRNVDGKLAPRPWKPEDQLNQYRKLRNCVAHRLGYVRELDIDDETGALEISWREPCLYIDERRLKGVPYLVKKGSNVIFKIESRTRVWKLGTRVEVTGQEVSAMAMDLWYAFDQFIGAIMTAAVHVYDRRTDMR